MEVKYSKGSNWKILPEILPSEKSLLSLSFNDWDDFDIRTTFNATLFYDKKRLLDFSLKILIPGVDDTPVKLNELIENGWDGYFPIPDLDYVSLPSDISFYKLLLSVLSRGEAQNILVKLKDAGYQENVLNDTNSIRLAKTNEFTSSLLREGGARKAYKDGWLLFENKESSITDFSMRISNDSGTEADTDLKFRFNSGVLPYDINVLIGKNGIGKSYTLKLLVDGWLKGVKTESFTDKNYDLFDKIPNLSKMLLISYSPFENFAVDLSQTNLKEKDAYKYFGFRKSIKNSGNTSEIVVSKDIPSCDSIESFFKLMEEDAKYSFMNNWKEKYKTVIEVLKTAVDFDSIAVSVSGNLFDLDFIDSFDIFQSKLDSKYYLALGGALQSMTNSQMYSIKECISYNEGLVFVKNNNKVDLSSGQRLFCYIVVNVVGHIKQDSLIVVDEPELFLHPTLEIEFISMLKQVLSEFNSKAILATHSPVIVREVPANCVHVYRDYKGRFDIDNPPFETFGGDIQRISSYVFGDKAITKPFDVWIKGMLSKYNNEPQKVIDALGDEINEELMIKILNMGDDYGL